jgi:hypothetical protein
MVALGHHPKPTPFSRPILAMAGGSVVSLKKSAPVAQMDRANASEALGRKFESCRVHHFIDNVPRIRPSSASFLAMLPLVI